MFLILTRDSTTNVPDIFVPSSFIKRLRNIGFVSGEKPRIFGLSELSGG